MLLSACPVVALSPWTGFLQCIFSAQPFYELIVTRLKENPILAKETKAQEIFKRISKVIALRDEMQTLKV